MRPILPLAAFVLAFATPASAADTKKVPGLVCQSNSSSAQYDGATVYNSSTSSSVTLSCPLDREGTSSVSFTVYALDRSSSANVSCYGSSTYMTAVATGWWTSWTSTSGYSDAPKTLSLGSLSGNSGSSAWVECSLPAKGTDYNGIQGLYFNES